jgi:hypothetical protein
MESGGGKLDLSPKAKHIMMRDELITDEDLQLFEANMSDHFKDTNETIAKPWSDFIQLVIECLQTEDVLQR